jgi:hypothetical protein
MYKSVTGTQFFSNTGTVLSLNTVPEHINNNNCFYLQLLPLALYFWPGDFEHIDILYVKVQSH